MLFHEINLHQSETTAHDLELKQPYFYRMKNGKCVIFSAPSGAGKTTLVRHLIAQTDLKLSFSVSATSRPKRKDEVDGKDYHFMSAEEFKIKANAGKFVEWEEVYPNQFYGTLKSEIDRIWSAGHHVIFDVDVVGGVNLKKQFGVNSLAVFVQPPSIDALSERLKARGSEDDSSLKKRLGKASEEMTRASEFDVVVINDDLETAKQEALALVTDFLK
jgi:guanylate kinase